MGAGADEVRGYYRKILPFYELESVAHAHLAFWRRVARGSHRVLELGSGFGRITDALAAREPAFGIELSLEMLSSATRRRGSGAHFVAADLREPPFRAAFDLVIAPADPISHMTRLADRRRALAAVRGSLVPGGLFVLEGLHRRATPMYASRREVRHAKGVLTIRETWFPAGGRDVWHARYGYRDRRPGEPDRTGEAAFVARAWNPRRIRAFFGECGFTIESIRGDFDGRPFRASSPRMVVFARNARRLAPR
jgi:SAM-dependent methyltransferase